MLSGNEWKYFPAFPGAVPVGNLTKFLKISHKFECNLENLLSQKDQPEFAFIPPNKRKNCIAEGLLNIYLQFTAGVTAEKAIRVSKNTNTLHQIDRDNSIKDSERNNDDPTHAISEKSFINYKIRL